MKGCCDGIFLYVADLAQLSSVTQLDTNLGVAAKVLNVIKVHNQLILSKRDYRT